MFETLDYANGHMPGAREFHVIDLDTGERLFDVVEANAKEGWREQIVTRLGIRQRDPSTKRWKTIRLRGPIEIRRPIQNPETNAGRIARAEAKRARKAAKRGAA